MLEHLNGELWAFAQVVFIDLVLAGDNAVVVGVAAAGVPLDKRARVIAIGIGIAVVLRILFALIATQLLQIIGLTLAGGILLLWVCWKLWRELRQPHEDPEQAVAEAEKATGPGKSMSAAIWQITLADVSMSLDNVLAVAGAARDHLWVLVLGLMLSVAFMGLAASLIARLLNRFRWIAYLGLLVIVYVALNMIWHGGEEVAGATHACEIPPFAAVCDTLSVEVPGEARSAPDAGGEAPPAARPGAEQGEPNP